MIRFNAMFATLCLFTGVGLMPVAFADGQAVKPAKTPGLPKASALHIPTPLILAQKDDAPPMVPDEEPGAAEPSKKDVKANADEPAMAPEEDAGSGDKNYSINGSARGSYWSSDRNLTDIKNLGSAALWLNGQFKPTSNVSFFAEGWARSDNLFKGSDKKARLREAYADVTAGPVDIRIGRQIIVWGRADRINPTDNLSPRDFTLLVPEDDDERFGAYAAKARYSFGDFGLIGVWVPEFRPNKLPFPRKPTPVTVAPGLILNTTPEFSQDVPNNHNTWGIKLEQAAKSVDWSVSYFNGFDLNPDLSPNGFTANPIAGTAISHVKLSHHRIRVVGADAAMTLGRYGVRAEAAYTRTEDNSGNDPFIKNPFFYAVVGGDRTFFEYLNINLQYFFRQVQHWEDPEKIAPPQQALALEQAIVSNQRDRNQHGVTFRISNKWMNETLEAEIAGIYEFKRHGYLIRPKVTYAISDKWKGTIGANILRGPDQSFFGLAKDNTGAFAEIKYIF